MNGCSSSKIENGQCICDDYCNGRCLNKEDTVSYIDGQYICPYKAQAIQKKEWDDLNKE